MNLKTTLILLLVCGALIAAVWLIPDIGEQPGESGASAPLFRFMADDVVRVEIRRGEKDTGVLMRGDTGWRIRLEGLDARADEGRVLDIIDAFEHLVPEKTIRKDEITDRVQYGLAANGFRVKLTLANGTEHSVNLGRAMGRQYLYASTEADGPVYVIPGALRVNAGRTNAELRETKPVALRDGDVKTVTVSRSGNPFFSARLDPEDLKWKLTAPGLDGRGDRESIEGLRVAVTDLTVRAQGGFESDRPEDLEVYGLAGTETRVVLTAPETETTRVVCIGETVEDDRGRGFYWMVEGEPSVYRSEIEGQADAGLPALLARPVDAYRDRNLLQLDYEVPNLIKIVHGDSGTELERGKFDWTFKQPVGETTANGKVVGQFVRKLKRLTIVDFADELEHEQAGFAEDEARTARFEIRLDGQEDASVFEVGRRVDEDHWYVLRRRDGRIVVATEEFVGLLRTPWYEFRDVNVAYIPKLDVSALEIRRGEIVESVRRIPVEDGDYEWKPAEGLPGRARFDEAIMDLLARLDPLRAVEYVGQTTSAEDLQAFGLATPEVEICATLTRDGKTRRITLKIGAAAEGKPHHARLIGAGPEDALVFTISEEAWQVLTEPVIEVE